MAMQAAKTTFETQRSPFSRSPFLLCCWRSKDDICRWRHVQKTPLWVLRLLKLLPEVTRAFQKYPFLLTEFLIYGRFWSQLPSKFRKFLQIHLLFGDGWFDRLHLVSFHSFARPEFLNASVSSKAWIIRIGFKEWFMSPKKASPGRVIYLFSDVKMNVRMKRWCLRNMNLLLLVTITMKNGVQKVH